MTTTVHLLRHGEVYNPEPHPLRPAARASGSPISAIAQAKLAAEFLAQRPIGQLVSSPLQRAQETAGAARRRHRAGRRTSTSG